jgi:hypothetical protein
MADRCFLNVDLDVGSLESLAPLIEALEPIAHTLERPLGMASFELNKPSHPGDPGHMIFEFVRALNALPPPALELWQRASRRTFDVGIQSHRGPASDAYRLAPQLLTAVASVNAELTFTIYPLQGD